jgi:hypothetical protein
LEGVLKRFSVVVRRARRDFVAALFCDDHLGLQGLRFFDEKCGVPEDDLP